ncbi:MAG: Gfo/Idh/MocA family oxidoreductase [Candidatus Helarchaeota archaeon]|nr:Gfo/Idh/MocA family oxidoreductase [Candidatus Helarchaeota archaeon]
MGLSSKNLSFSNIKKAVSPGDRITVGMIGVGSRAQQLIEAIKRVEGTEIVAVCDAYKGRLERALQRTNGRAVIYSDYKEILAKPDIDVVVIATPDHWHKIMIIDSLEAGKDVYVEKPMTYAVEEGVEIIKAVRRTRRILQVGSQGMSSMIQRKAREMIQSGKLGKITMIRASYNRNTASGAWIYPIPPDVSPKTVNWEMFLGPAPKRPYSLERFFRWRCYWEYSGGISTDLFVHLCTTIHFIMNAKMPAMVVGAGQLYRWKESRNVPDSINGIMEYPEGFVVNLSSTFNNQMSGGAGFQILGTEGSIQLGGNTLVFNAEHPIENNDWIVKGWSKKLEDGYYKDPKVKKSEVPSSWEPNVYSSTETLKEEGLDSTTLHFQSFFDCVRKRKQPVQDAVAGHHAASCAHLINISARKRRFVYWDFNKDSIKS